ncbi:MAG: polysaccharide deacetylase family protein [Nitrospira sp.]
MRLVVTIDVEEDQWGIVPHGQATAHNVYRLQRLQALLNGFGIIPTYLVTYPVVQDPYAVGILREILEAGECEIGAHCHPWNTPPFKEPLSKRNSMLCNLPSTLQYEKLQRLHEAIQTHVGRAPIAFRSGRWGFDTEVARNLLRLGYRIDTSVTPYTSWVQASGPDFSSVSPQPYAFAPDFHTGQASNDVLAEIPATIGYLHGEFQACAKWADRLNRAPFGGFKFGGLLSRLHVLRKVWLSPEMETPARMMQLVRQMRHQQYEWLNLVFHSSALLEGCGPFVLSRAEEQAFLKRLSTFLCAAAKEGIVYVPLSEAAPYFVPAPVEAAVARHSSSRMANCSVGPTQPFA